jgi:hypothetical protein
MEIYMDDLIVYVSNFEEYMRRLRAVFQRMREKGIVMNTKKLRVGQRCLEVCGHVIDERGLTMSEEKKRKVIGFPKPTHEKHLKSFLGLANYFHDHILNHSITSKPLYNMVKNYKRGRQLVWTPEATKAYEDIVAAIAGCQLLWFLNDTDPIFLMTDSSQYGIGGYLVQIVDGVEHPIAFVSKTLTPQQQRWKTIDQECFAIYYSITNLEHLLRGRQFTRRTDHLNLKYINVSASDRVYRWKCELQHFDFLIEHIPGEKNVVADSISRLPGTEEQGESVSLENRENGFNNHTKTSS